MHGTTQRREKPIMAQTTIQVNERSYQLSCGEGEEARLAQLAAYVSARIEKLQDEFGKVGDDKLMVMSMVLMADEVLEALDRVSTLEKLLPTKELAKLAELAAGQAAELAKEAKPGRYIATDGTIDTQVIAKKTLQKAETKEPEQKPAVAKAAKS